MNTKSDIVPASQGKALITTPAGDAGDTLGASNSGEVETGIDAPLRVGLTIAFLVFGVFGIWSLLAPIESSAQAQGFVTPRSFKKPIQHLEGGIVKEVLVQNGDFVEAGDVLLIMDSTRPQSELGIISGQMLSLLATEARLLAERTGADEITWRQELRDAGAKGVIEMNTQTEIFNTRKAALEGNVAVLEQRISQLEARVGGLEALRESKEVLAASFKEELDSIEELLAEGFESRVHQREVERNYASAAGEVAQLTSDLASTQIQIGETELEIQQQQNTFQTEVASELSEVQNQLKDTRERFTTLTDIVRRTEVTTLESGIVNGLKVHSSGSVIPPGEVVAEIVPQNDELVIDAALSLGDIDRVAAGQEATIRLPTLNAKTTPTLYGHVLSVSADSVQDQNTGSSYYNARIAVSEESLADLDGMVLVSGMPAEVFIATGSRTFMQYAMRSVTDSWAKSFRED